MNDAPYDAGNAVILTDASVLERAAVILREDPGPGSLAAAWVLERRAQVLREVVRHAHALREAQQRTYDTPNP